MKPPVLVVGAGIAGIACARELAAADVAVQVLDRGRRLGGRLAVRTVEGRAVDLGASYLTAADPAFREVVDDWVARGLAHAWTDTFSVADSEGLAGTKTGPVRYGAPGGLRSLVEDLARGLDVRAGVEVTDVDPGPRVDGQPASAVVLAMPDEQALDVLSAHLTAELAVLQSPPWQPTMALAAGWDRRRRWDELDGVFVNDSPVLTWIADDGRRRRDGAPVLVAHSTAELAGTHLDAPEGAREPMLRELCRLLDIADPPRWSLVKRWSLARPAEPRQAPFFLGDARVGLCGDGWHAPSRAESAFLSGRALGRALVARLVE